jgi:hypothetical protein
MKEIAIYAMCLFLFLFSFTPLYVQADETKSVTAEGRAIFTDNMTPAEARAIALNNARRHALEKTLGKPEREDDLTYNNSVLDELVNWASRAHISEEKILESRWHPLTNGGMAWYTQITTTIAVKDRKVDRSLMVTDVFITRPGQEKGDTVFHPGEKIQVRTKVSKDSYVQFFGIDQHGLAFRLFPVRMTAQELLSPGETFIFPTEHEMKFGLKIRVSPLKGVDRLVESIMVIAWKQKGKLLEKEHIDHATVTDIMRELSTNDAVDWAVKTASYEVKY